MRTLALWDFQNVAIEKFLSCPEENKNQKTKGRRKEKETVFFLIWNNSEHSKCFMEPNWCKDAYSFLSKLEFIE